MARVIGWELDVLGSHGMAAADYPAMLALIEAGDLQPQRLVERMIGLEEAAALLPVFDSRDRRRHDDRRPDDLSPRTSGPNAPPTVLVALRRPPTRAFGPSIGSGRVGDVRDLRVEVAYDVVRGERRGDTVAARAQRDRPADDPLVGDDRQRRAQSRRA